MNKPEATDAVNWFALTNVVGSEDPFHETVEFAVKPKPLTVRVNAGPPACAEGGARLVMVGAGFAALIVKLKLLLTVPAALTATEAIPGEAIRLAAIEAVN
jgi:hypothetical protein